MTNITKRIRFVINNFLLSILAIKDTNKRKYSNIINATFLKQNKTITVMIIKIIIKINFNESTLEFFISNVSYIET